LGSESTPPVFLGLDVVGLDRVGVRGRAEQHAGIRFEVPVLARADRHRPLCGIDPCRRREDEGGAAAGL
jgi:hypothetical protein